MTLARTYAQVSYGEWKADIGEIGNVPMAFVSQTPLYGSPLAFQIPMSDSAALSAAVQSPGTPSETFLVTRRTTPVVNPPGTGPAPLWQDDSERYDLAYVTGVRQVISTVPAAMFSDLQALVALVAGYVGEQNNWDSNRVVTFSAIFPSPMLYPDTDIYPGA